MYQTVGAGRLGRFAKIREDAVPGSFQQVSLVGICCLNLPELSPKRILACQTVGIPGVTCTSHPGR